MGGNEGGSNYIEVIRKNGDLEKYSVVTGLTLEPEDVVRIHTGNGGGCGKLTTPSSITSMNSHDIFWFKS